MHQNAFADGQRSHRPPSGIWRRLRSGLVREGRESVMEGKGTGGEGKGGEKRREEVRSNPSRANVLHAWLRLCLSPYSTPIAYSPLHSQSQAHRNLNTPLSTGWSVSVSSAIRRWKKFIKSTARHVTLCRVRGACISGKRRHNLMKLRLWCVCIIRGGGPIHGELRHDRHHRGTTIKRVRPYVPPYINTQRES